MKNAMGKTLYGIAGVCVLIGGIMWIRGYAARTAAIVPSIEIVPSAIDFGMIKPGARPSMQVKIFNRGKSPINLLSAIASCGCTTTTLGATTLLPQGSTSLDVSFISDGYAQQVEKKVVLRTNDRVAPDRIIDVRAYVAVGISVYPATLLLGAGRRGDSLKGVVTLSRDRDMTATNVTITGDTSGLVVQPSQWTESENLPTLHIGVATENLRVPGVYHKTIEVNAGTGYRFPILVSYEVLPTLGYEPTIVSVSGNDNDGAVVKLKSDYKTYVKSCEALCNAVQVEVVRDSDGSTHLALHPASPAQISDNTFDLLRVDYRVEDDGTDEQLIIPVKVSK